MKNLQSVVESLTWFEMETLVLWETIYRRKTFVRWKPSKLLLRVWCVSWWKTLVLWETIHRRKTLVLWETIHRRKTLVRWKPLSCCWEFDVVRDGTFVLWETIHRRKTFVRWKPPSCCWEFDMVRDEVLVLREPSIGGKPLLGENLRALVVS